MLLHAGGLGTHPVPLLENHLEDLLREEEEVKASEDDGRLADVEVLHRVKTEGLQRRTEGSVRQRSRQLLNSKHSFHSVVLQLDADVKDGSTDFTLLLRCSP